MTKKKLLKIASIVIFALSICFACGGRETTPSFYIRPDYDFSYIKKVAILPLDNLTNEKFAGEIVRQVVICELLASGLVDVTVPGDVDAAIEKLGLRTFKSLNADQIKSISNSLKVQAVILGSVDKFGEMRIGNISAPEVTITLMMADATSGSIIWSITKTGGGSSFLARHFGAKSESMSEAVLRVVREAVQTLYKY